MSEICPICNGLFDKQKLCDQCGGQMIQAGKLEDYNGPYSPYLGQDIFVLNNEAVITGDNCCVHLYTCPNCNIVDHGSAQYISI